MAVQRKSIKLCTGHYSRKQKLDKQQQESALKVSREQLTPPEYLSEKAKAVFRRVVEQAAKAGFLDNLDVDILADYSYSCSAFEDAAVDIGKKGALIRGKINPSVYLMDKAHKSMIQCSRTLGISSIDRLRLVVPKKADKKENKFLQLIKNG